MLAHHPSATHFRYPYVYGPYQLVPREWCVVRRILDRRPFIVLPDDGLTLCHYGYAENLAHALLLAIDRPDASAGQIYNCGDEEVLTLRQVVELIADALSAKLEIVSLPYALAVCARPLVMQHRSTHRVFDLAKLRTQLGYRDVVPAREAVSRTARWLADHPLEPGGVEERILQDPFDYRAEDALVSAWRQGAIATRPTSTTTSCPATASPTPAPAPATSEPTPASDPETIDHHDHSRAGACPSPGGRASLVPPPPWHFSARPSASTSR